LGDYAGLRLDQDTGGAIRAPGRCDLYMGVGPDNERRAGAEYSEGRLYYLIAKDQPTQ
jgi:membrane-bound lytic murein transglycosylase A